MKRKRRKRAALFSTAG